MKTIISSIFILSFILLSACASKSRYTGQQLVDYQNWQKQVSEKVEPIWNKTVRDRLKSEGDNLKKLNRKVSYSVSLGVVVKETGEVLEVKITEKALFEAFNLAAVDAFTQSSPLPTPPVSVVENGKARLAWILTVGD